MNDEIKREKQAVPTSKRAHEHKQDLSRAEVRARLLEAGILVTDLGIPENIRRVSDEEIQRAGQLAPGARSSDEIIHTERGSHERLSLSLRRRRAFDKAKRLIEAVGGGVRAAGSQIGAGVAQLFHTVANDRQQRVRQPVTLIGRVDCDPMHAPIGWVPVDVVKPGGRRSDRLTGGIQQVALPDAQGVIVVAEPVAEGGRREDGGRVAGNMNRHPVRFIARLEPARRIAIGERVDRNIVQRFPNEEIISFGQDRRCLRQTSPSLLSSLVSSNHAF